MGNCDHSLTGSERLQRHLNLFFRLGIERRSGFVEQENRRIFQNRACNGQSLLLPAGKKHSLVADEGVVFFRLRQNELVRVSHLRGAINIISGGIEAAKKNVIIDGVVEQKRFLCDQADLLAQ